MVGETSNEPRRLSLRPLPRLRGFASTSFFGGACCVVVTRRVLLRVLSSGGQPRPRAGSPPSPHPGQLLLELAERLVGALVPGDRGVRRLLDGRGRVAVL